MRNAMMLLGTLLLLAPAAALAQGEMPVHFYIDGQISLPTGDFGDVAGTGFGGGAGILYPVNDMIDLRGEAGYLFFSKEEIAGVELGYSLIPILALAQVQLGADIPLYAVGGLGVTLWNVSLDPEPAGDWDDSGTEFTFTFGAAFELVPQFTVEGRYNIVEDTNHMTVQANYLF